MRYITILLILLASLLFSTLGVATSVSAAPAPPYAVVQVERLNVRSAPSLDAQVVGQVTEDDRVTLLGRNESGSWLRVESAAGLSGWIYTELAQTSVPLTALTVFTSGDANTTGQNPSGQNELEDETSVQETIQAAITAQQTEPSSAGQTNGYQVASMQTVAPSLATQGHMSPAPNRDPNPVGPTLPATGSAADSDAADTPVQLEPLCLPNHLRSVSLGGRPQSLTALGERLYVALADYNSLMVVDTGIDMMLGSSRTTAGTIGDVTSSGDRLFIADVEEDRLIVTSRQGALTGEIALPAEPGPLAVTDGRVFVLHPKIGAISITDLNSQETVATVSIGPDPREVAVIGGRAFIVHAAGFLSVVDGYGQRQEQLHLPINDATSMVANPKSGILYIASAADQKVVSVDTTTWTLANTWTLDTMPSSLAYNPVTDHLFVLDTTSQFLTVLSGLRPERVGRVQVSRRPAEDDGNNLIMLQGKLYISHPSSDTLAVWLDRTCDNEIESRTGVLAASYSRTDLAPRRVEARLGILWPHGGASPDQASFANITATLVREDGASPACAWEPTVTLWAAAGDEPAQQMAVGNRRMVTHNGIEFPVYDFNDVDVRVTRDERVPLHFSVRVEGVETAQNIWTHSTTGQYVPTVRPELEGLVNRTGEELDARLWVEESADGPQIYAMLMRPGTLLGLTNNGSTPVPQLRWALDNGVTEPELIVGQPETRQDSGFVFTVWRFPGLNPDDFLADAAQVRFWVESPEAKIESSVIAWGNDIRTLGARLPIPVVGC